LGGNDDFHIDGGYDLIISETNDADRFFFSPGSYGTSTTVTGFNGAGVASGDVLYVSNGGLGWDGLKITEANGKTKFVVDNDPDYPADITVNAIGLKQDVDYFFV
jgi:hypothetical protein